MYIRIIITLSAEKCNYNVFLLSRFMYYSHQFYGIASDPMSGAMIATTIGFVGMLVCGIASAFFASEKGGNV